MNEHLKVGGRKKSEVRQGVLESESLLLLNEKAHYMINHP